MGLTQAHWGFQIAEHMFCSYFTFEMTVRFCAFRRKRDCLQDTWFKFDFGLLAMMVLETWVEPVVIYATGIKQTLPIGPVKLLRLLRLARLMRLLRNLPELVTMITG